MRPNFSAFEMCYLKNPGMALLKEKDLLLILLFQRLLTARRWWQLMLEFAACIILLAL